MTSSIQQAQTYQQAVSAYVNGSYEEAVTITDSLIESYPDAPNLRLLLGHIYCCLQRHEMAREQYQIVLELTSDPELVECANTSLRGINQVGASPETEFLPETTNSGEMYFSTEALEELTSTPVQVLPAENLDIEKNANSTSFDSDTLDPREEHHQAGSDPDPVFIDPFSIESATLLDVEASTPDLNQVNRFPSNLDDLNQPGENTLELEALNPTGVQQEAERDPSLGADRHRTDSLSSYEATQDIQAPVDFFDDLGELSDVDLSKTQISQSDPAVTSNRDSKPQPDSEQTNVIQNEGDREASAPQISPSNLHTPTPDQSQQIESRSKPSQRMFALLDNASLRTKQLLAAGATGIISALAVMTVSQFTPRTAVQPEPVLSRLTESGLIAAVAGIASGVTTFAIGQLTINRIKRTTDDLQAQFDAVIQGDFKAQATTHSSDELGQLAASFNLMIDAIHPQTDEARPKAGKQETANEKLSSSDLAS